MERLMPRPASLGLW